MFVTIDFETFYSKDVGFRTQTTEEYIRDPQFHVIGMGIKIDDEPTRWVSGDEAIRKELVQIDWSQSALLCHNALFDGAILAWHFGVVPAFYYDTLCMARAVHGVEAGGSLAKLAERYLLGQKGTEVVNAFGKRLEDFSSEELDRYGDYCKNDVDLTYELFRKLSNNFPESETYLIDITLRMFTQPVFCVDDALLVGRLDDLKHTKAELLRSLKARLGCTTEDEVQKILSSNKKFAELLTSMDIPVPMKVSATTGKEAPALAKNDVGFIALTEHEDPFIQQLCAVRLGTKSTLEESRVERFIGIGQRNEGRMPVPLKYYGAHTGRWAGMDSINFQNLPSRDKSKKTLKNSVVAPPGHVIIDCDSSQIEARVLAWLAGQTDVVEQFVKGEDVYSSFATKIYERPISKATPVERFVGKTCVLGLGYGTGALKLQHTLKTTPPGADIPEIECRRIVDLYRRTNHQIVGLWRECDQALRDLMAWDEDREYFIGKHKAVRLTREGVRLPNGLYIRYDNLRMNDNARITYTSRKGPVSIWGGAMVENIVQALARIIVGHQMLLINPVHRIALTVHDAAVIVVPQEREDTARKFVSHCMSIPPEWAAGLPVACEVKSGPSYGETK